MNAWQFMHSVVDRHLRDLHFGAIMNQAAVSSGAYSVAGCISRIEIAGHRICIYFPSVVTASFPKCVPIHASIRKHSSHCSSASPMLGAIS